MRGGDERGNEEEEEERKTISRMVPQRQASMTLYLSSSRAEEGMKKPTGGQKYR